MRQPRLRWGLGSVPGTSDRLRFARMGTTAIIPMLARLTDTTGLTTSWAAYSSVPGLGITDTTDLDTTVMAGAIMAGAITVAVMDGDMDIAAGMGVATTATDTTEATAAVMATDSMAAEVSTGGANRRWGSKQGRGVPPAL